MVIVEKNENGGKVGVKNGGNSNNNGKGNIMDSIGDKSNNL